MKEKYAKASKEKLTVEELIERQEEEIENLQAVIMSQIDQSAQSLTRLSEIALRPNPLTAPDYIDMMIQGEEREAKPGYKARVQALEALKGKAQVSKKDKKRQEGSEEQLQKNKQQNFLNFFNVEF